MSEERRGGDDPSGQAVQIEVVAVPAKGSVVVRLLGPVNGIWTHWHGGKSVACTGGKMCPPAIHRGKTIWKGYAACERFAAGPPMHWVPAVLEFTESLIEVISSVNPRGQVWRLERSCISARRTECRGNLIRTDDPRPLRTDVDVEAAVRRLYRSLFVEFGLEPPFGARQRLTPGLASPDAGFAAKGTDGAEAQISGPEIRDRIRKMRQGIGDAPTQPNGKRTH